MTRHHIYTLTAFLLWGLFPFYFHAVNSISPLEILAHRAVWSCVLVLGFLAVLRRWAWLKTIAAKPSLLLVFFTTSALMALNWGTYVYAIVSGQTIEASLGYFINPLLSVLLGAVFLKERLEGGHWLAIGVATLGVLWIAVSAGTPPWIGLTLATSWSIYGLIRKIVPMESLEGMTLECAILLPAALLYFAWLYVNGSFQFIQVNSTLQWLLLAAGPVTTIPLLFFTAGIRKTPYSTVGVMQFISPSIVFLTGYFCFEEPLDFSRLIGFILIWAAVILFATISLLKARS